MFLYIFCFYIVGPLQSSMLAGGYSFFILWKRRQLCRLISILSNRWILTIFSFQFFLLILAYIYSLAHSSYDLDYFKIILAQIIQFVLGIFVIAFLSKKHLINTTEIIRLIIAAYLIQCFIELAASAVPAIASITTYFSGDSNLHTSSHGTRGLGLSGSNGWGLSLSFGMIFLLYVKEYMDFNIRTKYLFGWFLLILGTFFAGRTGLAGAILSMIYIFFFSHVSKWEKFNLLTKLCLALVFIIVLIWILFPEYIDFAVTFLLPYALEPLYNLIEGRGFTSISTDDLMNMWSTPISLESFLWGDGYLIGYDGKYYQHIDIGVLRNLFYWGIFGYTAVIAYQLFMVSPMLLNKDYKVIMLLALIYIGLCDCKAMTIGVSKMLISILFLINYVIVLNGRGAEV